MSTIEKLWILQLHYNKIKELESYIREPISLNKINQLSEIIKNMEANLKKIEDDIKVKEKSWKRNNLLLNDLEYNRNEIEKSLYSGDISDIKQLTALDKEREAVNNNIEKLENDILTDMETIEELKKEHSTMKEKFEHSKVEYSRLVKEHKSLLNQCNENLKKEREEIKNIIADIDKEVFDKFKSLIETKGTAVAEVVDNRCSGCNMVLPIITLDKLKNRDNIVFCENCHRILYLP